MKRAALWVGRGVLYVIVVAFVLVLALPFAALCLPALCWRATEPGDE